MSKSALSYGIPEFPVRFERVWAMPSHKTFSIPPIAKLLSEEVDSSLMWVDPFARASKLARVTNDLDTSQPTDYHMDAVDFLKMFYGGSVDGVLYDPPYCLTPDVCVFTKDGWKPITEVSTEHVVATLNTQTREMEWQKPTEIISQPYTGPMVEVNGHTDLFSNFTVRMTYNHRNFVFDTVARKFHWLTGAELLETKNPQLMVNWVENHVSNPIEYMAVRLHDGSTRTIPMSLYLLIVGCFYGGHARIRISCVSKGIHKGEKRAIFSWLPIQQDFNEKSPQSAEIATRTVRACIEFAGVKSLPQSSFAKEVDCLDYGLDFVVAIWDRLKSLGTDSSPLKLPDGLIETLSQEQSLLLLETIIGSITSSLTCCFYSSIAARYKVSVLTELVLRSGYQLLIAGSLDTCFVYIYSSRQHDIEITADECKVVPYTGQVYCLSTPNHTFLVKAGSTVFWTGNSYRQISEHYKAAGYSVTQKTTQASFFSNIKAEIARIVKIGGKVISFGWNSGGIGKKLGFQLRRLLLVPHGGHHNDTICTVEVKVRDSIEDINQ